VRWSAHISGVALKREMAFILPNIKKCVTLHCILGQQQLYSLTVEDFGFLQICILENGREIKVPCPRVFFII
jgi:hypothetical protein